MLIQSQVDSNYLSPITLAKMFLPNLPETPTPWPPSVQNSYQRLNGLYNTARTYVNGEILEPHRLEMYSNSLVMDAFPILVLLEESSLDLNIPFDWLNNIANLFVETYLLLEEHLKIAKGE